MTKFWEVLLAVFMFLIESSPIIGILLMLAYFTIARNHEHKKVLLVAGCAFIGIFVLFWLGILLVMSVGFFPIPS